MSREAANQYALLDLLLMRWQGKKYKPYPRPSDKATVAARARRVEDESLHRTLRPHLYQ